MEIILNVANLHPFYLIPSYSYPSKGSVLFQSPIYLPIWLHDATPKITSLYKGFVKEMRLAVWPISLPDLYNITKFGQRQIQILGDVINELLIWNWIQFYSVLKIHMGGQRFSALPLIETKILYGFLPPVGHEYTKISTTDL